LRGFYSVVQWVEQKATSMVSLLAAHSVALTVASKGGQKAEEKAERKAVWKVPSTVEKSAV